MKCTLTINYQYRLMYTSISVNISALCETTAVDRSVGSTQTELVLRCIGENICELSIVKELAYY